MTTATTASKKEPYFEPESFRSIVGKELFCVRWFNYSLLAHHTAKQLKMPPVPTCILTTKGRKSGRMIETPIFFSRDGDNFCIIGSKGGWPTDPAWFLNLQAEPNCEIYTAWRSHKVRARVATGEERKRIWTNAAKAYPPFDEYAVIAAPREIPVVVFEKR